MPNQRMIICGVFSLVLLCLSPGCHTTGRSADGEKVYFVGTGAYHRKLRKLLLTEDQARARLVDHLSVQQKTDYWSRSLAAIVGDSFLFSGPCKTVVDLRGYYVDARTGVVSFHEQSTSDRYVRPPFGAFVDYPAFK